MKDSCSVGSADYFQYIPLSSVISPSQERTCYLSGIQIFNAPYKGSTIPQYIHSLKLFHDQNYISFTFSCVEFNQPERLEYRYKLDGEDNDWVYAGYLNRTVSYSNLAPGNYTFHASVKNDDGSWSNSDLHLPVIIIPAWWQTTWFKIASLVAACIAALR